ncbi:hypothetical protein TrRE_jg7371 [Triparma retinervis]|uniref:Uncharacterized protein n=1 Tax=Triparma retinervis TaxID=2557542 RepID=A0A9W6ZYA9_9STRA|nr:hypothetical protein TrRE_jg7371 [Triparma retinervis]
MTIIFRATRLLTRKPATMPWAQPQRLITYQLFQERLKGVKGRQEVKAKGGAISPAREPPTKPFDSATIILAPPTSTRPFSTLRDDLSKKVSVEETMWIRQQEKHKEEVLSLKKTLDKIDAAKSPIPCAKVHHDY